MPKPKRGRAEDDQPTLAGGSAAVRTPGESSSADAGIPSDAPTLVDLGKIHSNSPPPPRLSPVGRRTTTPGEPESTPVLQPQSVLGQRYEILELLGQGGMGAVYKARDREVNQLVALKVIRPDLASNPAIIERFKQELILARQVTHKNVIRIYDLAEADGVKFITMEYVAGEDLRAVTHEKGKLTPQEAIEVMRQVCQALDAAHSVGVIHRDLKPQNIMRDKTGRVLVMDFGLARTLEGSGMTQTGALVGTMEYMSPEQALGKDLDQRSDLFTAGLVFYELLTGKVPYKADSALASLLKRTHERAVPASQLDPTIPRSLSEIVSKCLERDPNQRYQNVQEVLDALDAVQGKRPISVFTEPPAARARKKWLWISAAGIVLVCAAIGVTLWLQRSRPRMGEANHPVIVLLADFQNSTSDSVFDGTLEPAFTLALEGARFINAYSRAQAQKVAAQLKPGVTALDEANAHLVAVREGINVVISGSVEKQGAGYRISCKAADAVTSRVIDEESIGASDKSSVLQTVGTLASRVRSALGDTTPESVKLTQQETFTSGSLDAAHEYAQGQEMRSLGKYDEAIRHFTKAVQLDPNFGTAYGSLAAVYYNQGKQVEAIQYYKLAMAHVDRMTDREKYRTRGGYYLAVADGDKAVEEFSALVQQYPADGMGLSALAFSYYLKHDMRHALEASRRAMELYPRNVVYHNNEALYALFAGDIDTAEREAEAVLQVNPGYDKATITIALTETTRGHFDRAVDLWHKIGTLGPMSASYEVDGLSDLALYRSDPAAAIALVERGATADLAAKNTDAAAKKYVVLAEAELMLGQKAEAMRSIYLATATNKEAVLFPAARAYASLGQDTKARTLAEVLSHQVDPRPQAYAKLVEGDIQLNHGHAAEAIKQFQESARISDTWLSRFELGRTYVEAGAFTDATTELEMCVKRRGEATDIYVDEQQTYRFFPPTYYYLGRALEGLKSPGATEAYRNFLALKVPNAQDPMVSDARRRLENK